MRNYSHFFSLCRVYFSATRGEFFTGKIEFSSWSGSSCSSHSGSGSKSDKIVGVQIFFPIEPNLDPEKLILISGQAKKFGICPDPCPWPWLQEMWRWMRCELVDETLAKISGIENPGSVGSMDPDSGTGSGTRYGMWERKKGLYKCCNFLFKKLKFFSTVIYLNFWSSETLFSIRIIQKLVPDSYSMNSYGY